MQKIEDGITLKVGYAVFAFDPNHVNRSGKSSPWYHMGIYIGTYTNSLTGETISNAVVQSTISAGKVIVSQLSTTNLTYYGKMPFVHYPWD